MEAQPSPLTKRTFDHKTSSMMDAYADDVRRLRSFMILDGADTGRILKARRLLPAIPTP
jgi:hypothetical protein